LLEKLILILNFNQTIIKSKKEKNIIYLLEINGFDPETTIVNLNLTDINIPSFYNLLNKWIDSLMKRLKYPELNTNLNNNTNNNTNLSMISNHNFFNLTGEEILIYAKKGNKISKMKINPYENKSLEILGEFNNSFYSFTEIEHNLKFKNNNNNYNNYFNSNSYKEIEVSFNLSESKYSENLYQDNKLNIDKNGIKQHYMKYNNKEEILAPELEQYQYIISEVTCNKMKREIYFYSPLVFHNKTKKALILEFRNKKENNINNNNSENSNCTHIVIIYPGKKIGIPISQYNKVMNIFQEKSYTENINEDFSKGILNNLNEINNLIDINEIFTNKFFFKEVKLSQMNLNLHKKPNRLNENYFYNEIKINSAYSVKNFLPFEITVLRKLFENPISLQKSEKGIIDEISFDKPLEIYLKISDFETKEPIIIKPFLEHEYANKLLSESNNNIDLENFKSSIGQKFANNFQAQSGLPNNLKTVKLYHKNYSFNNLSLEINALIYFKLTNFHTELVFLSSNVILNETGLNNMRLFYSHKKEIGMPVNYSNNIEDNISDYLLNENKCIYRLFNNSEVKFFINIFECESNSININDDIKPGKPIIAVCKNDSKLFEFVVSVDYTYVTNEMRKIDNQIDLLCRVITIKPRTILINNLNNFYLEVALCKNNIHRQIFKPKTKNSFYFFNDLNGILNNIYMKIQPEENKKEKNNLNYSQENIENNLLEEKRKAYTNEKIFEWSREINLRYQGLITIPINYIINNKKNLINNLNQYQQNENNEKDINKNKNNDIERENYNYINNYFENISNERKGKDGQIYLNIDIKYINLNMIVTITEATYENTQFLIENEIDDISIRVFQYQKEGINDEIIKPRNYYKDKEIDIDMEKDIETEDENKLYKEKNQIKKQHNKLIFSIMDYLHNSNSSLNNTIGLEFFKYENNDKNLDQINHIDFTNCKIKKILNSIMYYTIYENKILNHTDKKTYEYPIIDELEIGDKKILIIIETKGMRKILRFEEKKKLHSESLNNRILNTMITFQLEFHVKSIGISLISDNIFKDRKQRNYNRREILYFMLSEISLFWKKDSKFSMNYDDDELRFTLGNLKIDNMVSKHSTCKFPNFLSVIDNSDSFNNNNNPFFDLIVNSENHIFDKISKIKYLYYNIKTLKIAFDTDLIEDIILFLRNINYRLDSEIFNINKIFKDEEKNQKNSDIEQSKNKINFTSQGNYNHNHNHYHYNSLSKYQILNILKFMFEFLFFF
jgi:hypothetical protein